MNLLEVHEWVELAALAAMLVLLWDIHGYLREIAHRLDRRAP